MHTSRLIVAACSLVLCLGGAGLAQLSKPAAEAPAQAKADEKRTFNPFGDPKKFTRMGGWGGIGGAMGQMGFGQSMLVMNPSVQKELKLTERQQKALKEWAEDMRKKGETLFRRPNRDQNPDENGEQANPDGQPPARPGIAEMFTMMNRVSEFVRENESGFQEILTKEQRRRLAQITLQMEGLPGVLRPEVAKLLNLSDGQILNIQQILADQRTRQMGLWMQQAIAMQAERSKRLREREQAEQAAKPEQSERKTVSQKKQSSRADEKDTAQPTPAAPPQDEEARRVEMRKRFEKQFNTMREGTDQIQDIAVKKIYAQLTKRQRALFDNLLGDTFDVEKMVKEGGLGPRRPGQTALNEPNSTPETEQAKRTQPARKSTRLRDLRKGTADPAPDSQ